MKAIPTLSLDCYSVQHVLSTQCILVANIFAAVAIQLIAKYCVNTADLYFINYLQCSMVYAQGLVQPHT